MKKVLKSCLILIALLLCLTCCASPEKTISVTVREKGSGTREAFDRSVGDGVHFLEETDADGKKLYNTTKKAVEQTKNGSVLSMVAADKNAIGYVSLASLNDSVKALKIDGFLPTAQSVLSGEYKISRPFVIMTSASVPLTQNTADFFDYLKSDAAKGFSEAAGCIFIEDESMRAGESKPPIEIIEYTPKPSIDASQKIVIRGSTSVEKFIFAAAKQYAALYGVPPEKLFDIQLEGTNVGRRAVENDTVGNVLGLASANISADGINTFNVCLDAVAVIVSSKNTLEGVTMAQLYGIFSGSITKFEELAP